MKYLVRKTNYYMDNIEKCIIGGMDGNDFELKKYALNYARSLYGNADGMKKAHGQVNHLVCTSITVTIKETGEVIYRRIVHNDIVKDL